MPASWPSLHCSRAAYRPTGSRLCARTSGFTCASPTVLFPPHSSTHPAHGQRARSQWGGNRLSLPSSQRTWTPPSGEMATSVGRTCGVCGFSLSRRPMERSIDRFQVDTRAECALEGVIALARDERGAQGAAGDRQGRHGRDVGLERPDGPPPPRRRRTEDSLSEELAHLRQGRSVVRLVSARRRHLRRVDGPIGRLHDLDQDDELLVPTSVPELCLGELLEVRRRLRALERSAREPAFGRRERGHAARSIAIGAAGLRITLGGPLVRGECLADRGNRTFRLALRRLEIDVEAAGQRLLHVAPVDVLRIAGALLRLEFLGPYAQDSFDARLLLDELLLARRDVDRPLPGLAARASQRIERGN